MKKWALRFLISAVIELLPFVTTATGYRPAGARSSAMAYSTVALPGVESVFLNPAGISFPERFSFSLFYDTPFLVKEFSIMAAGVVLPTPTGSFGASFLQMGNGVYHENNTGLTYAKKLGDRLSAAIRFDYLSERMPESREPSTAFTVEGGILTTISERLRAGFYMFNPVAARLNTPGGKEVIPWSGEAGIAWSLHPTLLLCGEVEKTQNRPLSLRTGAEYSPGRDIAFRAGVSGSPILFTMGAGFRFSQIWFNIAFSYHGALGFTPSAGITRMP